MIFTCGLNLVTMISLVIEISVLKNISEKIRFLPKVLSNPTMINKRSQQTIVQEISFQMVYHLLRMDK